MAKRVSHPNTGARPKGQASKKSRNIKKYSVDIVFPTGHTRCAGTFKHGTSAIKKWRALVAQCTLADTVRITNRHMHITVPRRGMVGHC
jgi:hypothetical protein